MRPALVHTDDNAGLPVVELVGHLVRASKRPQVNARRQHNLEDRVLANLIADVNQTIVFKSDCRNVANVKNSIQDCWHIKAPTDETTERGNVPLNSLSYFLTRVNFSVPCLELPARKVGEHRALVALERATLSRSPDATGQP